MQKFKLPRYWESYDGSNTAVLYDTTKSSEPVVYMRTNLGWMGPLEVDLEEGETLEQASEKIALGYELEEGSRERAIWACGHEGNEEAFE